MLNKIGFQTLSYGTKLNKIGFETLFYKAKVVNIYI